MDFDMNDETASSNSTSASAPAASSSSAGPRTEVKEISTGINNNNNTTKNPSSSSGISGDDDFTSRPRLSSKASSTSLQSPSQSQDINTNSATTSAYESQSALTPTQEPNVVSSSPSPNIPNHNSSAQACSADVDNDDGSSSVNSTPLNTAINNTNNTTRTLEERDDANIIAKRREPASPPTLIFSSETPPPLPISHPPNTTTRVEFVLGDDESDNAVDNMNRLLRKTAKIRHNNNSNSELMMTNGFELPGPGNGSRTTTPTPKASVSAAVLDVNSNSHCSSLLSAEENFECYADGRDSFFDSPSENTSLQYTAGRDANDLSLSETAAGPSNRATPTSGLPFRRNSALRTSLRKSPQDGINGDMGHRRWGSFRNTSGTKRPLGASTPTSSNALATQLYRTGSFNSTGRSSTGDPEEMYSDGSLEDEVIDLTQKVHHLEEKFTVLAGNQSDVDDRYTRAKQENSELSTKLFLLEEQLRDVEQRGEDKVRDEQKRSKEALARLDREKQLQIENYDIRLQSLEKELQQTKTEASRQKQQLERERTERIHTSDKLFETEREIVSLRDDNRNLMEQSRKERESLVAETTGSQQALQDLRNEFEHLRQFQMANMNGTRSGLNRESLDGDINEIRSRLLELEEENKHLKQQNRGLEETNEDLTAQILNHGLEEGRHLLTLGPKDGGHSLAAEFEAMSEDQMKSALKEQKEVNEQLRCYIDGILLNIVENYPQLLEVKNKSQSQSQGKSQSQRQQDRRES